MDILNEMLMQKVDNVSDTLTAECVGLSARGTKNNNDQKAFGKVQVQQGCGGCYGSQISCKKL